MSVIRILPEAVANKIAAGEVVERPASVVKELLENSLDAGASRVEVYAEAGGKRVIRIEDDGCGMSRDDALLAFERHATSKIKSAEDLFAISTLGFRGEALPSIASVSRLTLATRHASEAAGTQLEIFGGRLRDVKEIPWPGGTRLEVRGLFYNTPARRKFLKSESTELGHIASHVTHYALAHPEKSFRLASLTHEILNVQPVNTFRERLYQVMGSQTLESLVEVEPVERALVAPASPGSEPEEVEEPSPPGRVRLFGFVSRPEVHRLNRNQIYFFVNRRLVRDRLILHAVTEAYRNMLPSAVFPVALIFLELPPAEVDVNVHPSKTEVRFRHSSFLHDFARDAIRTALLAVRPMPAFPARGIGRQLNRQSVHADADVETREGLSEEQPAAGNQAHVSAGRGLAKANETEARASGTGFQLSVPQPLPVSGTLPLTPETETFKWPASKMPPSATSILASGPGEGSASLAGNRSEFTPPHGEVNPPLPGAGACSAASGSSDLAGQAVPLDRSRADEFPPSLRPLGQIKESFIVATNDDGLWIIDQHVAHERVLFEQHLRRRLEQRVDGQRLLLPIVVELKPEQQATFEDIAQELQSNGFEVEPFGQRTVAIKTTPSEVRAEEAEGLLIEILDGFNLDTRNLSLDTLRHRIAASVACHAAIKVNMALTEDKMRWLLRELRKTACPMTCPHGRPIVLRYSMRDIQKAFKRI